MPMVEPRTSTPELVLRELTLLDAEACYTMPDRNRGHLGQHGDYQAEQAATLEWVRASLQEPPIGCASDSGIAVRLPDAPIFF